MVQNITNPVFMISSGGVSRVEGRAGFSSWFYNSETDSFAYDIVSEVGSFVNGIIAAAGLSTLHSAPNISVDEMIKRTIDGRALVVG